MSTPHYHMKSRSGEKKEDLEVLALVNNTLDSLEKPVYVAECNCDSFQRVGMNPSVRNQLDSMTVEQVQKQFPKETYPTIVLLSLGAENLKQEATQAGNLMKAGYNVELVLIGYNYQNLSDERYKHINLSEKHLPKALMLMKQFRQVLEELQKKYQKSCKIIGQFSSLEVYTAILEGKPAPQIKPHSQRTRVALELRREDATLNKVYLAEYQTYEKSCQNKPPQVFSLIDDISEMGNLYWPLSHRFTDGELDEKPKNPFDIGMVDEKITLKWLSFCESLYEKNLQAICEASRGKGNVAQQKILFLDTTKKTLGPQKSQINSRVGLIDIQDPSQKQVLDESVWEVTKEMKPESPKPSF